MKATGITRRIDDLGRIVVPIELRKTLNISDREMLEIYVDNDAIILKKYQRGCIFCSNATNLVDYQGKKVCEHCVSEIKGK